MKYLYSIFISTYLIILSSCSYTYFYSANKSSYSNTLIKDFKNITLTFKESNNNVVLNVWIPNIKSNSRINYINVKVNGRNPDSYKIYRESYIDTNLIELYNELYSANMNKSDVSLEYYYQSRTLLNKINVGIEYQFVIDGKVVTKDTSFILKRFKYKFLGLN